MSRFNILFLMVLALSVVPAYGEENDSSGQKTISNATMEQLTAEKQKSKGKPDDPGSHGRENAEVKKQRKTKQEAMEEVISEEFEDDGHGGKKKKND